MERRHMVMLSAEKGNEISGGAGRSSRLSELRSNAGGRNDVHVLASEHGSDHVYPSNRGTILNAPGHRDTMPSDPISRKTIPSGPINRNTIPNGSTDRPTMPNGLTRRPTIPPDNAETELRQLESISGVSQLSLLARGGEAAVFKCRYQERDCVVKVYNQVLPANLEEFIENREIIKQKIDTVLRDYAVPILNYGFTLNERGKKERYYEIMPFLSGESLEDRLRRRTFTFEEIKETILPQINKIFWVMHAPANRGFEEQRASHESAIIHCDVKPENIMYAADGTLRLVDFGIARLIQDGRTMATITLQGTPGYMAPEILNDVCCPATDYYALGITLYKLFTGHVPLERENNQQAIRGRNIQLVQQPNGMPDDLFKLIRALTLGQIPEQAGYERVPYERWTYEEVRRWCEWKAGDPPLAYPDDSPSPVIAPFDVTFSGQSYGSMAQLVFAMAAKWQEGKRFLFRQEIIQQFRNSRQYELESNVRSFLEQCESRSDDSAFYEFLCEFGARMDSFFWSTGVYNSLGELGEEMLHFLRNDDRNKETSYREIISRSVLSKYLEQKTNCTERERTMRDQLLPAVTEEYNRAARERERKMLSYYFAYILSEKDHDFRKDSIRYENILAMKKDLAQIADDPKALMEKCLLMEEGERRLDPQFEAWLRYQGAGKELEGWK